jgi:hypothetical protein
MNCESKCDCGNPSVKYYGPHDPDCHSLDVCCEDGRMCDKHMAEAEADHAYLKHVPRHQVFNDAQAVEERNQELRDCGRGHLVDGVLADRIDMARMRAKER